MFSSIHDFIILKNFKATYHPRNNYLPIPVRWHFPRKDWIKVNIDGSSLGSPGVSAGGAIFRDSLGVFLGAFSFHISLASA